LMGPDYHRVFMCTPDLYVSNQKELVRGLVWLYVFFSFFVCFVFLSFSWFNPRIFKVIVVLCFLSLNPISPRLYRLHCALRSMCQPRIEVVSNCR
jgi:hypothetical protein